MIIIIMIIKIIKDYKKLLKINDIITIIENNKNKNMTKRRVKLFKKEMARFYTTFPGVSYRIAVRF